jgi:CHAD domain-containing protein
MSGPSKRAERANPETGVFEGIITRGDSVGSAALHLIDSLYGVMAQRSQGLQQPEADPEELHRYRVAVRRMRLALRFFRPVIGEYAASLESQLASHAAHLGPARDLDVLAALLEQVRRSGLSVQEEATALARERAVAYDRVRDELASTDVAALIRTLDSLLTERLPALVESAHEPCRPYMKARLRKQCQRLERCPPVTDHGDMEAIHTCRKLFRSSRYYAEFVMPVAGNRTGRLAADLKQAAGALGDVRDLQLLRQRTGSAGGQSPFRAVADDLEHKAWKQFAAAWKRLPCELRHAS